MSEGYAIEVPEEPSKGHRVEALNPHGQQVEYWIRFHSYWLSRAGVGYTWAEILASASSYGWRLQVRSSK